MILEQELNTPITAPAFTSTATVLTKYRTFVGNQLASASELYTFLTTPSQRRDKFLSTLTSSPSVQSGYIINIYS